MSVTDEMVELLCRYIGVYAKRGVLPQENGYGVEVYWSQRNLGKVRLCFVTKDNLAISLDVKLQDMAEHGASYIDATMERLTNQLDDARKERQRMKRKGITNMPKIIQETDVHHAMRLAMNESLH